MEIILYCRHCKNIWEYNGDNKKNTSCSLCKKYVNIKKQRLDEDIPVNSDLYSGSKYLGISNDGLAHYWDSSLDLVACYDTETGRWIEVNEKISSQLNYLIEVSERIGWKYHIKLCDISKV